ncbi:MAG: hypothetical protein CVU90_12370 [Firmicutes bacterium HGW-Firmicutes-15]|nr:MAG: hypothetical protein CVU90_12370 [Firmicutes bacterium HGW-Firmicutes-15]
MDTIHPNETINAKKNKWINNILPVIDLLPTPLKYVLIFTTTSFIGSAAAYYINPTGLLCGVLAVLIYRWK